MNYQNYQNLMLLTSSDTKRTMMHLFLFIRLYATAINFPCIITLDYIKKVTTDGINNDTSKITNDGNPIDNNNDDNIIVFI